MDVSFLYRASHNVFKQCGELWLRRKWHQPQSKTAYSDGSQLTGHMIGQAVSV